MQTKFDQLFTLLAKSKFKSKNEVWNSLCERHQRSTPWTQANLTATQHKTNTQLRHHKIKIKVPSLEALLVFEFPRVTEFRTCGLPRLWIRAFSRHQENR